MQNSKNLIKTVCAVCLNLHMILNSIFFCFCPLNVSVILFTVVYKWFLTNEQQMHVCASFLVL